MNDYEVSDYSIFDNALDAAKTINSDIDTLQSSMEECKTRIGDESICLGPLQDKALAGFGNVDTKVGELTENFSKIALYFMEVSDNYQQGDQEAKEAILKGSESTGLIDDMYLGSNYSIANTKVSFKEFYDDVVQGKKLYQKSGGYSDWCLGFACTHAWGMYSGNKDYSAGSCNNSCEATTHFSRYKTTNHEEYMQKIYDELSNGKPVVIQVIGSKSKGTRHYVTAVGFKNNVTSGSQLKDTDILYVDSYDGEIKSVSEKGGSGRYIIQGTDTSNYKKGNKNYNYGYELYSLK